MASKTSQPALYEVIRGRTSQSVPTPEPVAHGRPTENGSAPWLGPGRSIRIPAGYVILGCGLAIILLASSYMVGHKRGYGAAKTEYDQQIISTASLGTSDPLSIERGPRTVANLGAGSNTHDLGSPATNNSQTGWKPVIPAKDPRQKGLNYFILAETTETGAKQLAEFCRSNGLETYVVSGKNDRSRRVVAFPGFPGTARNSPEVKGLEAQIHSVGEKWKRNKGSTDLRDAYPSLYGG